MVDDSCNGTREVLTTGGVRAVFVVEEYPRTSNPPGSTPSFEDLKHEFNVNELNDKRGVQGMGHHGTGSGVNPSSEELPSLASVATLCNSAIGAGVLSLPFAFSRSGDRKSQRRSSLPCTPFIPVD